MISTGNETKGGQTGSNRQHRRSLKLSFYWLSIMKLRENRRNTYYFPTQTLLLILIILYHLSIAVFFRNSPKAVKNNQR